MTHEELKREFRLMKAEMRQIKALLDVLVEKADTQPLMTMHAAAKRLNCSYNKMQNLVSNGEIGCTMVGKRKMFTEANIREYLNN